MSWWRRKPKAVAGPVEALSALSVALRAAGVSHYDGPVPGWDRDAKPVKLILGHAAEPAPASSASKPRAPFTLKKMSLEEREAAALGHVRLHGGG